jgi:hypothetical protein
MPQRTALAGVVAGVLMLAPAADANRPPLAPSFPSLLRGVHTLKVGGSGQKQIASCSAHRAHASSFERKLEPVACEQPPRSQLKIDVLEHAAANAAAAALTGP